MRHQSLRYLSCLFAAIGGVGFSNAALAAPTFEHITDKGLGRPDPISMGNSKVNFALWTRSRGQSSGSDSSYFRAESDSIQWFNSRARLAGAATDPLTIYVSSRGMMWDKGTVQYSEKASGSFYLMEQLVGSSDGETCFDYDTCASFSKSYQKTLLKGSYKFVIGIIPFYVNASLAGSVAGGFDARTRGGPLNGNANALKARTRATVYGETGLTAYFTGGVGVDDLAGFDVTAKIGVIGLRLEQNAVANQENDRSTAAVKWENSAPITLTTMNGKVTVEACLLFCESWKIVEWEGVRISNAGWHLAGSTTY
jgi:hypothetical protein